MVDTRIILGILLIVAAIIFYYLMRPKSSIKVPVSESKSSKPKPWYFPDFFSPRVQAELAEMRFKHKHKVKEKQHHEILAELGLGLTKKELSKDFQKLTDLVHSNQMGKIWREMSIGEKKAMEKLKKIVAVEEKRRISTEKKIKTLTKKERDYLFDVLKRISERK